MRSQSINIGEALTNIAMVICPCFYAELPLMLLSRRDCAVSFGTPLATFGCAPTLLKGRCLVAVVRESSRPLLQLWNAAGHALCCAESLKSCWGEDRR